MDEPDRKAFSLRASLKGPLRVRASLGAMALVAAMLLLFSGAAANAGGRGKSYFVYIGTYTHTTSKGIYAYRFSPSTGAIAPLGLVAETAHPSYLIVHPNRHFLYAVNEHESAAETGNTITAFTRDSKTGKLTFLNRVSSKGVGPCHIAIDKTGKFLVAANFGSGSVAAFPIHPDGKLGEASGFVQHYGSSVNPVTQAGPHAHCVVFSPDNRFVIVADRGLDRVFVYRLNHASGSLEPNDPPFIALHPGWGPRHLAFHPNGRYLYLISEMGSMLTALDYDASSGTLKEIQSVSALPEGFSGRNASAEVQVDRAGRFVYESNRGNDSIGVFAVDASTGAVTPVQHVSTQGKTPRNFSLDPTGAYLFAANQESASLVIFRVDPATGKLSPTGQILKDVTEPTCVLFVAAK
jgi:6-phosphogluconolactonase